MINLDWLSDQLCDVLRWQLAYPGRRGGPEAPFAGRRVWSIFMELNATRGGGMGPAPITNMEIDAWSRLRREPIRPYEMNILRALDQAFLEAVASKGEATSRPVSRPIPAEPPTSEAILAAFRKAAAGSSTAS